MQQSKKERKRELLFSVTKKDLVIEFFSGTGAGGQYRNKHQNCIRIHHPASGAIVTGQSARERKSNIRQALNNLVKNPKFRMWQADKIQEIISHKTISQVVDELMASKNLLVEIKDGDRWVPESTVQN